MCVSTHPATHPRTYAHARNHAHPYTHTHTRARTPDAPQTRKTTRVHARAAGGVQHGRGGDGRVPAGRGQQGHGRAPHERRVQPVALPVHAVHRQRAAGLAQRAHQLAPHAGGFGECCVLLLSPTDRDTRKGRTTCAHQLPWPCPASPSARALRWEGAAGCCSTVGAACSRRV